MSQLNIDQELDEFFLYIHIIKDVKSRAEQIKNQLYKEKEISVFPINPQYKIYILKATPSKMKRIFESLKPHIEFGEYMSYSSKKVNDLYIP